MPEPLIWLAKFIFVLGLLKLLWIPLACAFELRRVVRKTGPYEGRHARLAHVSVIVPAYNECKVIDACIASIVASHYPSFDVIVVDDGSSDDTADRAQQWADRYPSVQLIRQHNSGKGAALNAGLNLAVGEIVMLVDADGLFAKDTMSITAGVFADPKVAAMCGDDRPVNLDKMITKFLAFISHVGTGLVRRALDVLGCVPVISGNIGAFRRDVLSHIGPLRDDTLAEDLELTWRLHRAGYKVRYEPLALVYAECPSTLAGLWKQRTRWARGLLQALVMYRSSLLPLHGPRFSAFLWFSALTGVVVPISQVSIIVTMAVQVGLRLEEVQFDSSLLASLGAWSLVASVLLAVVAVLLNRSAKDLRYIWTVLVWPLYSILMSLVMCHAILLHVRRAPLAWNKLNRTGVVSMTGLNVAR